LCWHGINTWAGYVCYECRLQDAENEIAKLKAKIKEMQEAKP
jgi:hypothetical protein